MAIVTLDDMKAHLGVTDDADDALILDKISAAQAYMEASLGYEIETEFTSVPSDITEAVKQQTAHFYENREATIVGVSVLMTPAAVEQTIANRRRYAWS